MWIVCITSVRHVLTVNGYGGRQTKENEKSWCFKGWETLVYYYKPFNGNSTVRLYRLIYTNISYLYYMNVHCKNNKLIVTLYRFLEKIKKQSIC